jgi:hypothetical protein
MNENKTRFRLTDGQKARVEITKLSEDARNSLVNMNDNLEIAALFQLKNPSRWFNEIQGLLENWNSDLELTREQAYQEFVDNGGPQRVESNKSKSEIPLSLYLDDTLTIDNFNERATEATGSNRHFRLTSEQKTRVESGDLTREQAFQETVNNIRAKHAQEVNQ